MRTCPTATSNASLLTFSMSSEAGTGVSRAILSLQQQAPPHLRLRIAFWYASVAWSPHLPQVVGVEGAVHDAPVAALGAHGGQLARAVENRALVQAVHLDRFPHPGRVVLRGRTCRWEPTEVAST